jgi:hypothetical protein
MSSTAPNSDASTRPLIVTHYDHSKSIDGYESEKDWAELVEHLTTNPEIANEKDGAAFVFGQIKKASDGHRRHKKENVVAVHALAVDIDDADEDAVLSAVTSLCERGLSFTGWPTFGQLDKPKPGKLRCRLVFELSEPVPGKQWPTFWPAAMASLGLTELRDLKCSDASRLYFHTCPAGHREEFVELAELLTHEGEPLDVAVILASAAPVAAPGRKVDLNDKALLDGGVRIERCPRDRSPFQHAEHLCRTMPAAISGQGGHLALLRVARALRWGLRIGSNETAGLLGELFNPRCEPAWTDGELAHKVEAAEGEDGAPYALGSLLPPPPDSFEHLPLIVQRQGLYWMRETDSDDYARRCFESDLVVAVRRHFPEELTSTWHEDDKPLGKAAIEKQSWPVSNVEPCYWESTTTYQPDTETLVQGLRVDPKLRPVFDADVEAWLVTLAGARVASLKQWIAGTRNDFLRAPSRALAIVGQKDTGKSLLAYGLARIWDRGPVNAIALCSRFNGALMNCPAVLADEQIPPDLTGEDFRAQIVARRHEIEPKGKERVTLHGSVRLIVTANDLSKLFIAGSKGANDVAAIADRLFVVHIPDSKTRACFDALQPLKDPKDPSGSGVDLVRIAQHFLWIQQNVEPARGRFIGAPEDPLTEALLLAAETDRAPDLFDLFRDYLASADTWEGQYKLTVGRPVPRRGEVCPEARMNFPLVLRDDRLFVRFAVLGQLIGRDLLDVSRACKPFKVGTRDTSIAVDGGKIAVHELNLSKLLEALEGAYGES